MIYVNDFEFYETDGSFIADPFGMEGGTFGDNLRDAIESASDWLTETINCMLIDGKEPDVYNIGNTARHGGKVIAVSVDCDLSRVDAVTSAEAARMLNVSRARVSQLCDSGKLSSWRNGSNRMVTCDSIDARLRDDMKTDRPQIPELPKPASDDFH